MQSAMSCLADQLGRNSKQSDICDPKLNTMLHSHPELLKQLESQDLASIEKAMKAEYGEDNRLLDQQIPLNPADTELLDSVSKQTTAKDENLTQETSEAFDFEFNPSSFFNDDEEDDDEEFDLFGDALDRPSKRPRLVSPLSSDVKALHTERQTVSRSILDQLVHRNDSCGSLSGLSPTSTDNDNTPFLDMKARMRRVSLDLLNRNLFPDDGLMSTEFEPRRMPASKKEKKKESSKQVLSGEQVLSLSNAIAKSQNSQRYIQDWDRKMGLKRSHSRTMSVSSRSRERVLALLGKKESH